MKRRVAVINRKTKETQVRVRVNLDGRGQCKCHTGSGFLEHMFELLAKHARIDLEVEAKGDLQVDDHHLTEDLAIALGQALDQAWGDKKGVNRYGWVLLPMDEVMVAVALDLGGRFAFESDYRSQREKVGDLSTELVPHFFRTLAAQARINLHFKFLREGENEHHRIEAMFKGFARSLRIAVRIDERAPDEVPSTKGVL